MQKSAAPTISAGMQKYKLSPWNTFEQNDTSNHTVFVAQNVYSPFCIEKAVSVLPQANTLEVMEFNIAYACQAGFHWSYTTAAKRQGHFYSTCLHETQVILLLAVYNVAYQALVLKFHD